MNKYRDNFSVPETDCRKKSVSSRIFRFAAWWFGYTGMLASTTPCPFCGNSGCPTGIGISGLLGALFAFLTRRGEKVSGKRSRRTVIPGKEKGSEQTELAGIKRVVDRY